MKWERPYENHGNVDWRETGEPERVPDKYHFNPVMVDPIKHTAVVNTKHLLRRSAGGRGINSKDGNIGEIIAGSHYDERLRMTRQAAKKAKALEYIGTS